MDNPFFKEGDQLVYVIWFDNCEPYEDRFDRIEAIFSSWEEAESYLKNYNNSKLVKEEILDWVWSRENGRYRIKKPIWKYSEPDDYGYDPEWTIEIWNLSTGAEEPFDNEHIFLVTEE